MKILTLSSVDVTDLDVDDVEELHYWINEIKDIRRAHSRIIAARIIDPKRQNHIRWTLENARWRAKLLASRIREIL